MKYLKKNLILLTKSRDAHSKMVRKIGMIPPPTHEPLSTGCNFSPQATQQSIGKVKHTL